MSDPNRQGQGNGAQGQLPYPPVAAGAVPPAPQQQQYASPTGAPPPQYAYAYPGAAPPQQQWNYAAQPGYPSYGPGMQRVDSKAFYNMPSADARTNQWNGGGPVGSGVIPPDVEAAVLSDFADQQVRKGFQRKVFSIVAIQLLITVGFSCVCMFVNPVKNYIQTHPWIFYLSWGLSFGLLLVIACNERLRRKHPVNMVFLILFTLCEAFLVGMITSWFNVEIVLIAFALTAGAVVILAVIASLKCIDVTSWGSALCILGYMLMILIIVGIFWVNRIWYLVIAGIGAALTSVYIVYDLQLIMGGKQYAISPDEYVFASLSLYLDIVQLFIWILYILGLSGAGSD